MLCDFDVAEKTDGKDHILTLLNKVKGNLIYFNKRIVENMFTKFSHEPQNILNLQDFLILYHWISILFK